MSPSKKMGPKEASTGSGLFNNTLNWSQLENEIITSSAAGSSGMLRSNAAMYNQNHYSGLQSEATGSMNPQAAQSSTQTTRASRSDDNTAGTPSHNAGSSGVPRSTSHMFNQTRHGHQRHAAQEESDENVSGPSSELSSPIPTLAEYEAMAKAKLAAQKAANAKKESESTGTPNATASGQSQSNARSPLPAPAFVGRLAVTAIQATSVTERSIQTNSQRQSDEPSSSLFVLAAVTSSGTVQSVAPGSSLPHPPVFMVGGLGVSPAPQIHRRFRPSAVHTAMCDLCNKKNKTVIQRCQDCNMQFCKVCIEGNKVIGNHVAKYEYLEWNDVGPGLQPANTSQSRRKEVKKNVKSAGGHDYTPAASPLRTTASGRVTKSGSASRKTTRVATRASTAKSIRKSRDRREEMNEEEDSYAGSPTDDDPMDEDEVRKDYIRHQRRPADPLYARRQYQEHGFVPGRLMHGAGGFDSGFGGSMHDMHPQRSHERLGSSNLHSRPGMTGMDYQGAKGGYRVHESHSTNVSLHHSRPGDYPSSNNFGMDYGYSPPSSFHPSGSPYGMGHGGPRDPGAHAHPDANPYDLDPNYLRHPAANPYDMHHGISPHDASHPTANPYDKPHGSSAHPASHSAIHPHDNMDPDYDYHSGYGIMPPNARMHNRPRERHMGERFDRFSETLADHQKERKAAKDAWKEESTYQAIKRGFRYEVQAAWEGDPHTQQLLAKDKVKEAVEKFSAAVSIMAMKRAIKQDDIADIFQRVTSQEMTA